MVIDSTGIRALIFILTLVVIVALVALVFTTDDANAWTTKDNAGVYSGYKAGIAEYYYDSQASPTITYSRWETSSPEAYYYYYMGGFPPRRIVRERRCWLSVPIDDFIENTYIDSAIIRLRYTSGMGPPTGLRCYLLNFDPSGIAAEELFTRLTTGYYLGYDYMPYQGYYEVSISGTALTYLRDEVAKGSQYVYFGFQQNYRPPSGTHYTRFSATYSHLRTYIDASGPATPRINGLSSYTGNINVWVTWSATTDLPTGGSVGGITYQIGTFTSSHPSAEPTHTTGWGYTGLSGTLYNLVDGVTYYIKVRARDANGFESAWSSATVTTIDTSPPSIPVPEQDL